MSLSPELLALLACPKTGAALHCHDAVLSTDSAVPGATGAPGGNADTAERYPIINGVPWLLPNPRNSLVDWGAKLNHFNQVLLAEITALEKQAQHADTATAERLHRLIHGKQQFIKRVSELLFPVITAQAATKQVYDALRDRAPSTQSLLSYEANLYRDWVWGEEENALTAKLVVDLISPPTSTPTRKPKKLCVLGAGAGRLALDIHQQCQAEITVATDINPLLVMAAEYLLTGANLPMVEFPLHPRKTEYVAVEHLIQGQPKPDNFHFIFSDAVKPCFKAAAFDTVLTPWFIDIQPLEFSRFLRQLNQYLPIEGRWINFGSLVFNQKRDALCYSIEEVQAITLAQGFRIDTIEQHEIPYLKSPYNAGYRMENVWAWSATKIADVKALKSPQLLPAWLLDTKQAIPTAQYFQQFSFQHRVYAQLAAEVDGKTSLDKIARKFAKQNKMHEAEAERLITEFFSDLYRQNN